MISFSWLHLTDLHLGMAEQIPFLPTIKDRFFEDLKLLHERCGPWDLVLFTGDLTQKGSREEFQKVDEFLARLWGGLAELGSAKPLLLAVPGNHDLVRPEPDEPEVLLLRDWITKSDVRSAFWKNPKSHYRTTVETAFANYVEWWEKVPYKPPTRQGMLPGDFSATVEKSGASLGIVGLNSTALQLSAGDYEGKLAIDAAQFQAVCDGDGPVWVKKHNACLLLTHQPPSWLTPDSNQQLLADIAGNDYFAAHLFGHMHEGRYESSAHSGASTVRACQGTSLFGLEYFGEERKQVRLHGYGAGRIDLRGDKGTLTQWPRQAYRPGGQWNFAASVDFKLTDEHIKPEEFQLLKAIEEEPGPVPVEPEEKPTVQVLHPFPQRWAFLVGVNDYKDATTLRYCRQDVIDLAAALHDSLEFDNIFQFHEEAELKPERDVIFRKLGDIRFSGKVNPDDLLLFYFSGHGLNEGGRDYLLPIGASPRDVKTLGIRIQDLAEALNDIGCKHTAMFIDACREAAPGAKGAGAGVVSIGEESKDVLARAGIIAFFSCDPKDRSYEIEPLHHGSFTYCLLQAIEEGAAETVAELDGYLREKVPQINTQYGKNTQQPYAVIAPPEKGNLEIFFNPHRRIQAAQKFEPLIVALIALLNEGKDVVGPLTFLGQVKSKKQLDEKERVRVALIESLCEEGMELDLFIRAWGGPSRTRGGPQLKKPERLS